MCVQARDPDLRDQENPTPYGDFPTGTRQFANPDEFGSTSKVPETRELRWLGTPHSVHDELPLELGDFSKSGRAFLRVSLVESTQVKC